MHHPYLLNICCALPLHMLCDTPSKRGKIGPILLLTCTLYFFANYFGCIIAWAMHGTLTIAALLFKIFIQFYSVSPSSRSDEEECLEEAIDSKVVAQERKQDAAEDDINEDDSPIVNTQSNTDDSDDDEPLTDDVDIPFYYDPGIYSVSRVRRYLDNYNIDIIAIF